MSRYKTQFTEIKWHALIADEVHVFGVIRCVFGEGGRGKGEGVGGGGGVWSTT